MNRIKDILKERGITQSELARMLGVSLSSITKTLSGNPSQFTLERIASALEVPIWHLFVSPSEIEKNKDEVSITCPKCGYGMKIKVE